MDRQRFSRLWGHCAKPDIEVHPNAIFDRLRDYYGQDHRYYHTPQHVQHCLNQVDLAKSELDNADAVELAIWFHDVIYDPQAGDNEWQSTEWFRSCADGVLPSELIEQVVRLILITRHKDPPVQDDERFIVDVDLSGFALPWDEFIQESDTVRKEYAHQSDLDYAKRQIPFLQSLLSRKSIYSTDFFQHRYEQTARENINRKIKILQGTLG